MHSPPDKDDRSTENTPGRKVKTMTQDLSPPPLLLLCPPMSILPDPPYLPSGGTVKVGRGDVEEDSSGILCYQLGGRRLCCCYFFPVPPIPPHMLQIISIENTGDCEE